MNLNTALIGASMGFATAFVIDIQRWAKSKRKFNWLLASRRWIAGTLTGLLAALGVSQSGVQL